MSLVKSIIKKITPYKSGDILYQTQITEKYLNYVKLERKLKVSYDLNKEIKNHLTVNWLTGHVTKVTDWYVYGEVYGEKVKFAYTENPIQIVYESVINKQNVYRIYCPTQLTDEDYSYIIDKILKRS